MELNAEINKVIGKEMATLLAAKISPEEMDRLAQNAWEDFIKPEYHQFSSNGPSDLDKTIKTVFIEALSERIKELLKEPQRQEELDATARRIIDKARVASEEIMVRVLAENMAEVHMFWKEKMDIMTTFVMNKLNNP